MALCIGQMAMLVMLGHILISPAAEGYLHVSAVCFLIATMICFMGKIVKLFKQI